MVFFSISVFYASLVLCYNHSSSINSSLLHLPKTRIVSNSFTTIRGSTLQANMIGSGCKDKKNAFMSRCDLFKWDLEPGSEILFSRVYRTSFFIIRWETQVCVSPRTGLERFGEELGLSRSKKYKPWSLHLSELCMWFCGLNFFPD